MSREVPHESIWDAPGRDPAGPLPADVDVCVVGAGIAGLSTAYRLAAEGKKVLALDDGPVAGGQTQFTTAHLASAIDDRFVEVERVHGVEGALLAHRSHAAAIDFIERTAAAEGIDCDFARVDGYLFVPPEQSRDVLDKEEAAAKRAGAEVERVVRAPLEGFDTGPCLRFARQGQFHPLRYLAGLVRAIQAKGGQVVTGVHVKRVEDGDRPRVETADGQSVAAGAVVVATNSPFNDRVTIHTKQAPYLTYVVALESPRGAVPHALYWDTLDPYHYVRLAEGEGGKELLVVGGEDHKTGQAHDHDERFARLEAWARERFPKSGALTHRWAGQVMETLDGLAFLGRNPGDKNVYIATGDSGMGMTHGTLAGLVIGDLILGRDNPWAALYDPARKPLKTLREFLSENLNVAVHYGAWLTPGDVSSVGQIAPGGGAVVRQGLYKRAVYRDAKGELHVCSAVCPHLGGIVAWNDAQKTWDCPLHGSRFDARGKVLNGPANSDLSPMEPPAQV